MEVIERRELQKEELQYLGDLYAKGNAAGGRFNVLEYLEQQRQIYNGWCSTTMSSYLRKYAPEAGANLNRELENLSEDLAFIQSMFPEYSSEAAALHDTIQRCKAYHNQWLTNRWSLRQKTDVPRKLLC